MLLDIGGADYPGREPRFDVVYHLIALAKDARTVAAVANRSACACCAAYRKRNRRADDDRPVAAADGRTRSLRSVRHNVFRSPDLRRIQMRLSGKAIRCVRISLRGPRARNARPSFASNRTLLPVAARANARLTTADCPARGQS